MNSPTEDFELFCSCGYFFCPTRRDPLFTTLPFLCHYPWSHSRSRSAAKWEDLVLGLPTSFQQLLVLQHVWLYCLVVLLAHLCFFCWKKSSSSVSLHLAVKRLRGLSGVSCWDTGAGVVTSVTGTQQFLALSPGREGPRHSYKGRWELGERWVKIKR